MSEAASTQTRITVLPGSPLCLVTRLRPKSVPAKLRTSSSERQTFTPPACPRPPEWICALTTQALPPISRAR